MLLTADRTTIFPTILTILAQLIPGATLAQEVKACEVVFLEDSSAGDQRRLRAFVFSDAEAGEGQVGYWRSCSLELDRENELRFCPGIPYSLRTTAFQHGGRSDPNPASKIRYY